MTIQDYLHGKELPEKVDPKMIAEILHNPLFGIQPPHEATIKIRARIALKSEAEAILAGNDTVNCMPFEDGKSVVYTVNANTGQFLLQVQREGKSRTVAQSVLTKDMDIDQDISKIVKKMQDEHHLEEVLSEQVIRKAPAYIACDNIEVAPVSRVNDELIKAVYTDFFGEYLKRYGAVQKLAMDKVVIGMGFTDALRDLPRTKNTFAPQAPVSYSDKTGPEVYVLDMGQKNDMFLSRTIKEMEREIDTSQKTPVGQKGVDYLTFEDSLRVGYLEGKAYADNQEMLQYLSNMENCLLAKDINNAAKGRPNMSLKYSDESGKMRGYFLAYEGTLDDSEVLETSYGTDFSYKPILYLMDLATDRESATAGGRLVNGFTELYKKNYLDRGEMMPLFMQAREQTSYKLIQRKLQSVGGNLGIDFDLIELPIYKEGADTMHPVIIRPRKKV